MLKSAGVVDLPQPKQYIEVREPICVSHGGASVMIVPAENFQVSYGLEYPHPMLRQTCTYVITPETFEKEIVFSKN